MAKNELLENILDDLSVIKEKNEARDKRLEGIESALKELAQKVDSISTVPTATKNESNTTVLYSTLKDAVYDGMAEYFKKEPDHTGILTEANIKKMHDVIYKVEDEILQPHWAKENEDQEKKEQIYNEQRKTQGIESVHQVNEWAPDYPPEIQRTIRYLGLKILPVDEPVESTHQILRTWGDALMQITNRATPAPTLKNWLLYKWQQTKAYLHNRQALAYTLLYIGGMATVVCLSLYQSAVMDLDRTNRIFYHNVIRNKDGADDYHELDSLIHANSFFKTYRTLDK